MKCIKKNLFKILFPAIISLGFFFWGGYEYFIEKILKKEGQEVNITFVRKEFVERKMVSRTSMPERCYVTYSYIINGLEHIKNEELAHLHYCSDDGNSKAIYWPRYPSIAYLYDYKLEGTFLLWTSPILFIILLMVMFAKNEPSNKTVAESTKGNNLFQKELLSTRSKRVIARIILILILLPVFIGIGNLAIMRGNIIFNGEKTHATIKDVKIKDGLIYGKNCEISYHFTQGHVQYFREGEMTGNQASCMLKQGDVTDVIVRLDQHGKAYLISTAKQRFLRESFITLLVTIFLAICLYELVTGKIISFRKILGIRKKI